MSHIHVDDVPLLRWRAVVSYRTDSGTVTRDHQLEEISDLHDMVELGPHWDTIEKIEVHRINHCTDEKLTVEEAQQMRGTMTKPNRPRVKQNLSPVAT